MTKLQSLRKQYTHLKPFERAVMGSKAIASQDECLIEALTPPTMWDALHTCWYERVFELIAFIAVYESQKAEIEYLYSALLISSTRNGKSKDDTNLNEMITIAKNMRRAKHRQTAWILALNTLDEETGTACFASASMIAKPYLKHQVQTSIDNNISNAHEYNELLSLWMILSKRLPK